MHGLSWEMLEAVWGWQENHRVYKIETPQNTLGHESMSEFFQWNCFHHPTIHQCQENCYLHYSTQWRQPEARAWSLAEYNLCAFYCHIVTHINTHMGVWTSEILSSKYIESLWNSKSHFSLPLQLPFSSKPHFWSLLLLRSRKYFAMWKSHILKHLINTSKTNKYFARLHVKEHEASQ